jgi:hypothetical protein
MQVNWTGPAGQSGSWSDKDGRECVTVEIRQCWKLERRIVLHTRDCQRGQSTCAPVLADVESIWT